MPGSAAATFGLVTRRTPTVPRESGRTGLGQRVASPKDVVRSVRVNVRWVAYRFSFPRAQILQRREGEPHMTDRPAERGTEVTSDHAIGGIVQ